MANRKGQKIQMNYRPKKKTEPRTLWVRIVALVIAVLMFGSVLLAALQ